VGRPSPRFRTNFLKLQVAQSPFLRVSFGFSSLAKSQRMSKSPSSQKTGLHVLLSLSLWRRSSTGAHLRCTQ